MKYERLEVKFSQIFNFFLCFSMIRRWFEVALSSIKCLIGAWLYLRAKYLALFTIDHWESIIRRHVLEET
jgi:hypothetical protein